MRNDPRRSFEKKVVLYEIYREISAEILLTSENIFTLLCVIESYNSWGDIYTIDSNVLIWIRLLQTIYLSRFHKFYRVLSFSSFSRDLELSHGQTVVCKILVLCPPWYTNCFESLSLFASCLIPNVCSTEFWSFATLKNRDIVVLCIICWMNSAL